MSSQKINRHLQAVRNIHHEKTGLTTDEDTEDDFTHIHIEFRSSSSSSEDDIKELMKLDILKDKWTNGHTDTHDSQEDESKKGASTKTEIDADSAEFNEEKPENKETDTNNKEYSEKTENKEIKQSNEDNKENKFAKFFEKYDQIILNTPVMSDTGEDDVEDKQCCKGHDNKCQGRRCKGQGHSDKDWSIVRLIKDDKTYRRKLIHTVFLCWAFVILGWIIGQFGPSFLDLQVITHTRLEEGSAFMTSHSVGYLLGSLVCGMMFDKFNKILLLFSAILGNGLTVVIIPWCVIYELMIAIHAIKGLFSGGLDALGNAYLVYVWGDQNGSYMQAMHFAFAVGGIISPLATAPFLVPRHHDDIAPLLSMGTMSSSHDSMNTSISAISLTPSQRIYSSNITNGTGIAEEEDIFKIESRVYIAYLISAFLAFSAAMPFLVIYFLSKKNGETKSKNEDKDQNDRKLPFKMKILIMSNMMCMMGIYSAIEDTYAGFLTTFVVQQLNWTKTLGSFATSFYWAFFGTGRFFGIFLVKFCFPVRMISIYCMLLIFSFVGLLFSSIANFDEGLWVCVPLTGLAMSIIFPTVFTWTEEELLPVTGKIASLFLIASSSGTMVNPIVLGFLMDELTPMYFCYLLLGESIILFMLYISALFLSRNIHKGKIINEGHLDMEIPVKSNSEPDLYKGGTDNDSLLYKGGMLNGDVNS